MKKTLKRTAWSFMIVLTAVCTTWVPALGQKRYPFITNDNRIVLNDGEGLKTEFIHEWRNMSEGPLPDQKDALGVPRTLYVANHWFARVEQLTWRNACGSTGRPLNLSEVLIYRWKYWRDFKDDLFRVWRKPEYVYFWGFDTPQEYAKYVYRVRVQTQHDGHLHYTIGSDEDGFWNLTQTENPSSQVSLVCGHDN